MPDFTPEQLARAADVADTLGGKHRKWIEDYVASANIPDIETFDDMMAAANRYLATGEYHSTGDSEEHLPEEFWDHYEALKNIKVKDDERWSFFTCAC